jgi:hypothetical protein
VGKSRTTTENPPEKHEHLGEDPSTVDLLPKEQKNPSTIHNDATAINKTTNKTGAGQQSSGGMREHRKNPTTVELHPRRRETPSYKTKKENHKEEGTRRGGGREGLRPTLPQDGYHWEGDLRVFSDRERERERERLLHIS